MRRNLILLFACAIGAPLLEAQSLDRLISPGPLSRPHRALAGLENCTRCHTPGKGVEEAKCLACHQDLARRISGRRGLHRLVDRPCASCHPDHQGEAFQMISWDTERFDHAQTGSPLQGVHRQVVDCGKCHNAKVSPPRQMTRSFLVLDTRCVACHEDTHRGQLGEDCQRCHPLDRPFKSVPFDHARTRFPLRGAHRQARCESCHQNGRYRGIKFSTCADCHRDPHQPALEKGCEGCHTLDNWRVGTTSNPFDHSRTRYPLVGRHADLPCGKCHADLQFRGLAFTQCRDCHRGDVHQGQFRQDCAGCHTLDSFKTTTFDHALSRYPLTGKHGQVECSRCHKLEPAVSPTGRPSGFVRYSPIAKACSECHIDRHGSQFVRGCEGCHTPEGFGLSTLVFNHQKDSRYALEGKHSAATCSGCHRRETAPTGGFDGVRYRPINTDCLTCHKDYHAGQLNAGCQQCHNTDRFKPAAGFDHARTDFKLTGKHVSVECADCHRPVRVHLSSGELRETPRFKPLGKECGACHQNPHGSPEAGRCDRCHQVETFRVANFDHDQTSFPLGGKHKTVQCLVCHASTAQSEREVIGFRRLKGGCLDCHRSPHSRRYPDCRQCHTEKDWRVNDW